MITPDGGTWLEQDPVWWQEMFLVEDWIEWADYKAEHPDERGRASGPSLKDL